MEQAMISWQVGDVKITRVVELEATGGSRFILPDATPDACRTMAWMQPHFCTPEGKLRMSVHALVIDTGRRRIVVDTCIGNDKPRTMANWSHLQTNFLADLAAAGYPRESIDTVLCTHLHVDHVGWNTMLVEGEWQPTFPNARYLVHQAEWAYWKDEQSGESPQIMSDSVLPVLAAGLLDMVTADHRVCEEVCLESTPGHTPGHVSIRIRSGGQQALITGDALHHPCQMERLDWCSPADFDSHAAQDTRTAMLSQAAEDGVLVIGTHFAAPTAGHVRRNAQGSFWLDVGAAPA